MGYKSEKKKQKKTGDGCCRVCLGFYNKTLIEIYYLAVLEVKSP
jgi:hypothetical protein